MLALQGKNTLAYFGPTLVKSFISHAPAHTGHLFEFSQGCFYYGAMTVIGWPVFDN
jgi:hypothetical protein